MCFVKPFHQMAGSERKKNVHHPNNPRPPGGLKANITFETKGILNQCVFPAMTHFPFHLCIYLSPTVLSKANRLEGESPPGGTVLL